MAGVSPLGLPHRPCNSPPAGQVSDPGRRAAVAAHQRRHAAVASPATGRGPGRVRRAHRQRRAAAPGLGHGRGSRAADHGRRAGDHAAPAVPAAAATARRRRRRAWQGVTIGRVRRVPIVCVGCGRGAAAGTDHRGDPGRDLPAARRAAGHPHGRQGDRPARPRRRRRRLAEPRPGDRQARIRVTPDHRARFRSAAGPRHGLEGGHKVVAGDCDTASGRGVARGWTAYEAAAWTDRLGVRP
jgi:hypothetical protein